MRCVVFPAWLALVVLGCASARADTAELERQARMLAREAAERAYPGGDVSVEVVPLDARLQLEACEDLTWEIPGSRVAGRVSVHARCSAPVNWGVYLTAQVDVVLPVVVTARPVPRGSVVRNADLEVERHNLGELREGFLIDPAGAGGMTARTNLRAGRVLYQRQLAARRLVSKGDSVAVAARHGQVVVTARGVALADGVYGERIEIRNPRSERTVRAWVTGPGRVSTRPDPDDS
ncbi:MAG: flagellar basal body P-ring formation chaperone FlgA [Pseudomonadota bacterium]